MSLTHLIPADSNLWFLPLGGTGEIGMNLNLYGHDGQWLMVDCGVAFKKNSSQFDVQMADPDAIVKHRERLTALVLTHAHEDHIGAVVHLWPKLQCPVYATPFTACILRRKLERAGLIRQCKIIEVGHNEPLQIGRFQVEWININHSIPEAHGLLIQTPAGRVFHTGDWKLDNDPVVGEPAPAAQFQALSKLPVDAMVCDSTNAMEAGFSTSEGELFDGLLNAVKHVRGAAIVTTFASNVARLQTLARVATHTDRSLSLLGASLHNMVAAARQTGHWPKHYSLLPPKQIGNLPRNKVLVVATGSQGDTGAALYRLAKKRHHDLRLAPGDAVIFSSRIIPGNEEAVQEVMAMLKRAGIQIIANTDAKIHASGHPNRGELEQMYSWVKPQLAIPVHGTAKHLEAHASIAKLVDVPAVLTGLNGDLFQIAPYKKIVKQAVATGRLVLSSGRLKKLKV